MNIGPYSPTWIDPGPRALYAAYHPCAGDVSARRPVLLVPPLLHEQARSLRLACEIASHLASQGIACLRFAYFGTGDSGGEGGDADLSSMADDIGRSLQALRQRSGGRRPMLLALHSGALPLRHWLGREGSGGNETGDSPVLLWDPVLDGDSWLRQLLEADRREREMLDGGAPGADGTDDELMGHAASDRLRRQVGESQGQAWPAMPARPWAVLRAGSSRDGFDRCFELPAGTPAIGGGVQMDGRLTLTEPLRQLLDASVLSMAEAG